jgi:hypothetical protein
MTSDPSLSFKGRSCVAAINELCAKLRNPDCKYLDEISPSAVEDESRRFKVWANNIGAFQGPQKQSSLDYRLREAPQVRQQVVRLLDRLSFSATQGLFHFLVQISTPFPSRHHPEAPDESSRDLGLVC